MPNHTTEFQQAVTESLARLETQMESLVGNGQPGRIALIERQQARHNKYLNRLLGALIFVAAIIPIIVRWL